MGLRHATRSIRRPVVAAVVVLAAAIAATGWSGWWPAATPSPPPAAEPHPAAAAEPTEEPDAVLHDGDPQAAGLAAEPLRATLGELRDATTGARPAFPGAVALVAREGTIAVHEAVGQAVRFADGDATELPADAQRAMRTDTVVDLASLTKLFTTVAVLQLVEEDAVGLDDPVASVLPRFAAAGKGEVTIRQLLTHTGGLPAGAALWADHDTPAERVEAVLTAAPASAPGTERRYSDLGFIVLGELVEQLRGRPLDEVVRRRITAPLGMADTGFRSGSASAERVAATEHQPWLGRGLVHGDVADPNAWALGGVAGHAGMFSTARDLAVLAQALLNGGRYGHARILEQDTVAELLAEQLGELDARGQGLGVWRAPCDLAGRLTTPETVGHTGYTGTSMVIEPRTRTVVVLLTNRIHPSADGPRLGPQRRALADATAAALPGDHRPHRACE